MKYIIPVILNHIVLVYQFTLVRVITQILNIDKFSYILPVCNKTVSGCNKHRIIILATYSQR